MSAEAKTREPKKPTADDRKRKRRNVAIGVGAGLTGAALLAVLLVSSKASASPLEAPARKKPSKKPGKAKDKKAPRGGGSRPSGGGDATPDGGGSKGPGGDLPDNSPRRTSPDTSPRRTSPDSGPDNSPRRTSPDNAPVGPNPRREDLPEYINDESPDPGVFYQVTAGGEDAKGLFNIARRYALASLYLAARNVGGLSQEDAIDWAEARRPGSKKVREWADYILCVAWNDVLYGSNRVSSNNYRGPHGRGIPLSPMHADNWRRLLAGDSARRNVKLHSPGEQGTPRNVGQGDRRLPLLWMPQLDEQVLWDSDGQTLRAGGTWADGTSFFFPPPIVAWAQIDDPTGANLGAWGCGDGRVDYDG